MVPTVRIVLLEPFVKQAPGQVFEVSAEVDVSGWDANPLVHEKQNYSSKRYYLLPDGGNGRPYELLLNQTRECPDSVFEGMDLHNGPVRITASGFSADGREENQQPDSIRFDARLEPIDGAAAQAIVFPDGVMKSAPRGVSIQNLVHGDSFERKLAGAQLDLRELLPGFYSMKIDCEKGAAHYFRFMKSFPLLVTFDGNSSRYTTLPTLY